MPKTSAKSSQRFNERSGGGQPWAGTQRLELDHIVGSLLASQSYSVKSYSVYLITCSPAYYLSALSYCLPPFEKA